MYLLINMAERNEFLMKVKPVRNLEGAKFKFKLNRLMFGLGPKVIKSYNGIDSEGSLKGTTEIKFLD